MRLSQSRLEYHNLLKSSDSGSGEIPTESSDQKHFFGANLKFGRLVLSIETLECHFKMRAFTANYYLTSFSSLAFLGFSEAKIYFIHWAR